MSSPGSYDNIILCRSTVDPQNKPSLVQYRLYIFPLINNRYGIAGSLHDLSLLKRRNILLRFKRSDEDSWRHDLAPPYDCGGQTNMRSQGNAKSNYFLPLRLDQEII